MRHVRVGLLYGRRDLSPSTPAANVRGGRDAVRSLSLRNNFSLSMPVGQRGQGIWKRPAGQAEREGYRAAMREILVFGRCGTGGDRRVCSSRTRGGLIDDSRPFVLQRLLKVR
jgi:hypothetical protein